MSNLATVFVSYTRRDGEVSNSLLERISSNFSSVSTPYVHALDDYNGRFQQLRVIWKLFCSQTVFLITSSATKRSPWVAIELILSRIMLKPIIRMDVKEFRRLLPNSSLGSGIKS